MRSLTFGPVCPKRMIDRTPVDLVSATFGHQLLWERTFQLNQNLIVAGQPTIEPESRGRARASKETSSESWDATVGGAATTSPPGGAEYKAPEPATQSVWSAWNASGSVVGAQRASRLAAHES